MKRDRTTFRLIMTGLMICWGGLAVFAWVAPVLAQDVPAEPAAAAPARDARSVDKPYIPTGPMEIAQAMGYFFVVPFVIASFISVWFIIERVVVLRRARVIPRPFVERFLQHLEEGGLDQESALTLCEENDSPVARVFAHAIRKWGKPSVEVEQAVIDGGERETSQLRKHLKVLNGVATVTPLFGLLGTVIGMIQAFNQIANMGAVGKAEELAVGIGVALLTTAAGLLIAIPSLIMYMYLSGKVDSVVMEMDEAAQNVVHLICAEALSGQKMTTRTRSKPAPKMKSKAKAPQKESA
ncbi:MAG: biopolymer transporter ExbB [Planctomyces sp.]|nr:biopolymer transporter ExbB [Planctomyces sp.]